jgi:prevent-host-death family protein
VPATQAAIIGNPGFFIVRSPSYGNVLGESGFPEPTRSSKRTPSIPYGTADREGVDLWTIGLDHGPVGAKDTVPISQFKARCLAILAEVKRSGRPVLVTRFGEPVAKVVPPTRSTRPDPGPPRLANEGGARERVVVAGVA